MLKFETFVENAFKMTHDRSGRPVLTIGIRPGLGVPGEGRM